ncbi:hypothetical protein [Kitasatospora aureofaciens]|uniref:hypothetical protein n=1 Tax=Kitasatospora aureofaciens TaxID=1894 RepID=UPI0033C59DE9
MVLRNTAALVVETVADLAPSLPDPATAPGRTHLLVNTGTAAAVWSSTGTNPFQQGGVSSATLTLARGSSLLVQSDGAQWVVRGNTGRPVFAASGVSNTSGDVVFAFPAGMFTAPPVVSLAYQGAASASPVDYRVTALSATSCTVNVRQSLATVVALIGLTILAASAPLSGATITLIATTAGATP